MTQTTEQRRLIRLAAAYNHKARIAGTRGWVKAEELLQLESSQWGDHCHYCGITLEVGQGTFDHMIPLDKGGPNTIFNLVRCCLTCNREKFTKSIEELAEHRARTVTCAVCGTVFKPRFAEYENGRARLCSRRCSALWRWHRAEARA